MEIKNSSTNERIVLPKHIVRLLLREVLTVHMDNVCRLLFEDGTLDVDTMIAHSMSITRRILNLQEDEVEALMQKSKEIDVWSAEIFLDFICDNVIQDDQDYFPVLESSLAPSQN